MVSKITFEWNVEVIQPRAYFMWIKKCLLSYKPVAIFGIVPFWHFSLVWWYGREHMWAGVIPIKNDHKKLVIIDEDNRLILSHNLQVRCTSMLNNKSVDLYTFLSNGYLLNRYTVLVLLIFFFSFYFPILYFSYYFL
jgi:hypothetical protein